MTSFLKSKVYTYKHFDSSEGVKAPIEARITYGQDDGKARAIAVWFHGGGFVTGHNEMIAEYQLELLVENGFVVVSPNYRLAPTVSVKDGPIADCVDAFNWARDILPDIFARDTSIELDAARTVTLGHSCGGGLALFMGGQLNKPRAILDFFGMKYFQDSFWSTPNPAMAGLPNFDPLFLAKVFEEIPPPTSCPPPFGPSGPDFSKPRNVFMFDAIKRGTFIHDIVRDGNYDAIDSAPFLSRPEFPPTFILQGDKDSIAPCQHSLQAQNDLRAAGNTVHLHIVEGAPHGFDIQAQKGDTTYELVRKGIEFLREHCSQDASK